MQITLLHSFLHQYKVLSQQCLVLVGRFLIVWFNDCVLDNQVNYESNNCEDEGQHCTVIYKYARLCLKIVNVGITCSLYLIDTKHHPMAFVPL